MRNTVKGLLVAGAMLVGAFLAVDMLAGYLQQHARTTQSDEAYSPQSETTTNHWNGKTASH